MSSDHEIDLAYRLLDLDLVDCNGRRCGKVDDLELAGAPGEATYVAEILVGNGALPNRMPAGFRRLAGRVFREEIGRLPWTEVEDFDAAVHLRSEAAKLGLGRGDDRAARIVGKIPGSG
jgi:hypothetical protein